MATMDRRDALMRIGIAYFIWLSIDQWARLIQPFMMWELQPQPDMLKIGMINSVGNVCMLVGSFLSGYLLDNAGTKPTALVICVLSGAFLILSSQVKMIALFACVQMLKIAFNFPAVCEAFVGSLHGESDNKGRIRSLMWLGVPNGLAMVIGPWIAGQSFVWVNYDLHISYAMAGALMFILLLPVVLFVVPEPRSNTAMQYSQKLPLLTVYKQFAKNGKLMKSLLFRFLVDSPFQAYDQMSRYYFVSFLIENPADMSYIAILIGLATLFTNTVLIKPMQRRLSGQRMLQLGFGLLTVAYLGLSSVDSYYKLMFTLPIQVVGVSISLAVLSAQVIGSVEANDIGKAAGLGQGVTGFASAITPFIAGYFISTYEFSLICYISAAVSLFGIVLVQLIGSFMKHADVELLPGLNDKGA